MLTLLLTGGILSTEQKGCTHACPRAKAHTHTLQKRSLLFSIKWLGTGGWALWGFSRVTQRGVLYCFLKLSPRNFVGEHGPVAQVHRENHPSYLSSYTLKKRGVKLLLPIPKYRQFPGSHLWRSLASGFPESAGWPLPSQASVQPLWLLWAGWPEGSVDRETVASSLGDLLPNTFK